MTTPPATPRARRVAVPRAPAARDDLADAHYASAFALPVPRAGALTAERWARAAPIHHRTVPRLLRRAARDAVSTGETTRGDGRLP
ncbi:hypothetical protein [Streptomyces melanosporofaciens]|uniref:Uncharacterized protein n=1 Tax=Streptomyces melanosporofaciens TaxID=67327 RepID=A0A1H5BQJ6_STRMJ|nr:hypothetical protein [Streptomyces melanosporofaciens]SED56883.1 hypothetical protein SAMN04490356_9012 [Streptomyces melanosporofaciens]